MHSPGAPMFEGEVTDQREDSFRLLGDGWPPTHLALSKQVGEDGWRLVYYTSLRQVLRDHAATLKTAAVVTTLIRPWCCCGSATSAGTWSSQRCASTKR